MKTSSYKKLIRVMALAFALDLCIFSCGRKTPEEASVITNAETEITTTSEEKSEGTKETGSETTSESTAESETGSATQRESTAESETGPQHEPATESTTESQHESTADAESEVESTSESEVESSSDMGRHYHLWDYAYGERAMTFLRTINDNFPHRVTGNGNTDTTTKDACGAWIDQTMRSFGYTPTVQTFDHVSSEDSVRITSYIYRKTGGSSKRVVVGAHYDCAETRGAEDNGTGVSLLLETAERFASINTDLTIDFCFFDGEEYRVSAGAYYYLLNTPDKENIVLYINLDSIGAGDHMFAYGGEYEDDVLIRDWGYRMAMEVANDLGIDLRTIPPLSEEGYRAPTRTRTSDQIQFVREGIPYVYFEANAWVDESGQEHHPNGFILPFYNTNDPAFSENEGQIIHSRYDDLDILEQMLPGRIRSHISDYSRILTVMLIYMNQYSPEVYAGS